MKVTFTTKGLTELTSKLVRFPVAMHEATQNRLDEYGDRLLAATVRNASGRPGPKIVTGQYVSRFVLERTFNKVRVVNHSPQTNRLEYGFVGTDSAGRFYNQPPFPHFRPALAEVGEQYKRSFRNIAKETWSQL